MVDQNLTALAHLLEVLASPARLQILSALRRPASVRELKISAARNRSGERPGRTLAPQTVSHHVDALETVGLVRRLLEDKADVVLDHAQLFASVDEIRQLSKLRSIVSDDHAKTAVHGVDREPDLPDTPRLMVAYGRDDGTAFALRGGPGSSWTIGRDEDCDITLDYDPYASGSHARLEQTDDGFVLHDLDSSNGTFVDWHMLPPGADRTVPAGALVGVGRSVLVLQC